MKKRLRNSSSILFFLLTPIAFASNIALTCKDLVGVWKGDLGSITHVTLTINTQGNMMDGAYSFMSYGRPYGGRGWNGGLQGTCQKAADGRVFVHFLTTHVDHKVDLTVQLIDKKTLAVPNISYEFFDDSDMHTRSGKSFGTLTNANKM